MLTEKQQSAFTNFSQSVDQEGTLDPKTAFMIRMATAIALGCHP